MAMARRGCRGLWAASEAGVRAATAPTYISGLTSDPGGYSVEIARLRYNANSTSSALRPRSASTRPGAGRHAHVHVLCAPPRRSSTFCDRLAATVAHLPRAPLPHAR